MKASSRSGLAHKSSMSFASHPVFTLPEDPQARIFRYMDLAKFLDVLETRSLYFSSIKKLTEQDPFEGWYTGMYGTGKASGPVVDLDYSPALKRYQNEDPWAIFKGPNAVDGLPNYMRAAHSTTCVSCWHLQAQESAAMWSIYGRDHQGIALVSSVAALIASLAAYEKPVYIGTVKYLDYTRDLVPTHNGLIPFVTKRISFQHEHELRALITLPDEQATNTGISVPVKVDDLMLQVLVSPTAPEWLVRLVQALVKRYGLSAPVQQSGLMSLPA